MQMSLTTISVVPQPLTSSAQEPNISSIGDNQDDDEYFVPFKDASSFAVCGDDLVIAHETLPTVLPAEMNIPDEVFCCVAVDENDAMGSLSDAPSEENEASGNDSEHSAMCAFQNQVPEAKIFRYKTFIPRILGPRGPNGQDRPVWINRKTRLLRRGLNRNETTIVIDSFLYLVEWTPERQERNDLDFAIERSFQWSTQMHIHSGQSLAKQINLGLAFNGLQIQTNVESKTFTETETVRSEQKTLKLTIPPRTQVFFYVRRWHIMTRVWFVNSWPGPMAGSLTVGNNQNPSQAILREIWSTIVAQENMWKHTPVTGTANMFMRPISTQPLSKEVRPWNWYFPTDVGAALRSVGINPENE